MSRRQIKMLDIVPFNGKSVESLPEYKVPYYLAAQDGFFLRKNTALGLAIVPIEEMPAHLGKLNEKGDFNGQFDFTAPKLPATIISRAFNFFRNVHTLDKTEAEVFILYKDKEYDLFIPYQVNTAASVNSIYDPADIPVGWQLVGSMHSHPNMGAFHSGTDENDAATFGGLHITMGHVEADNIQFAAMISVNQSKFHFPIKDVAEIPELIDLEESPKAWLDCVVTRDQVLKMKWPSLTEEDIKQWDNRNAKVTYFQPSKSHFPSANGKGNKTGHRNWQSDGKDFDWYAQNKDQWQDKRWATRYSRELARSVDVKWLDEYGRLKDEFVVEALENEIGELQNIANSHGRTILFDIFEDEKKPEVVEDEDIKEVLGALLPGAFQVRRVDN
jgi:hypothetical protein